MENLLIIRGWSSASENWVFLIGLLKEKGYRVWSPDLPGFGKSLPPASPWSIDDYVEWVKDFCEKNNLSQFFLLGHSFGGSVAIKYCLKYPAKVKKLILIDSAGIRRRNFKKEIMKKLAKLFNFFSFLPVYPLVRNFLYRLFLKSDYPYTQGVMKETYLKITGEDLSDSLTYLSTSTLIIWGKNDKLTPIQDANFMKAKISGSTLETISNIGHNPHREAPEKLAEIVIKFLKS